jgi:tetratricopeptide (TPR) repeat protein
MLDVAESCTEATEPKRTVQEWLELGHSARRAGDRGQALAHYQAAHATGPRNPWPRIEAATELRELRQLEEAEALLHAVLVDHPNHVNALLGLAQCAKRRNDIPAALAVLAAGRQAHPENVWPAIETGHILREANRTAEAEEVYASVLECVPTQPHALVGLGMCARRQGDRLRALILFEQAVAGDGNNAWARLEAATELRELGRLDEAEAHCEAVLARDPQNAHALSSLGHCARRRGERAKALAHFRAAAEFNPGSP